MSQEPVAIMEIPPDERPNVVALSAELFRSEDVLILLTGALVYSTGFCLEVHAIARRAAGNALPLVRLGGRRVAAGPRV